MAVPSQVATTGDFSAFLTPEQAEDYFKEIEKTSIVQRLARKVPMGPTGISIPHWNGTVQAQWVGEGEQKPLTKGSFNKQELKPTKIAVIFAESAEVVRLNPLNYIGTMRTKIAEAFALAFDAATMHGDNKPTNFGGFLAQTTKEVSLADTAAAAGNQTNVYQSIGVTGLSLLVNAGKKWNGTLLDNITEPFLNGSVDSNGRPLFVESTYSELTNPFREGRILSRPTVLNDHVAKGTAGSRVVGFMGDFSQCIWGQIGGISFDVTDQATLDFGTAGNPNLVSLWQHNMVAVRAEAEFAWLCNDTGAFVKLTDKTLPTS
ncbi:major capsid protein [Mycobacterium phage MyraDee]|uniref:Major capsid protein n=1 Tax=Mycobacterium phage MyraDee TaxID=2024303 RepID=A0A222YXW6_9CAUD|nr:major capsid protein [Mycobacterium phage MyraDee]ASR77121.1 major capsid protein [Mycobacterium phage MyraDee]